MASPATIGVVTPVLVSEDTIYQLHRKDQSYRLMFVGRFGRGQYAPLQFQKQPISAQLSGDPWLEQVARPKSPESALYPFRQIRVTATAVQPFFLRYQSPPPSLFFDTFASVVPKVLIAPQSESTLYNPPQPFIAYTTRRPSPTFFPEFFGIYSQVKYQAPFANTAGIGNPGILPYSFEIPDLNDNPWLEQVARPKNPELAIFPFRQIPQTVIGQPYHLMWWHSRNWDLEAEWVQRFPDNSTLNAFRWVQIITPPPPLPPLQYPVPVPYQIYTDYQPWCADTNRYTVDSANTIWSADGGGTGGGTSQPPVSDNPNSPKPKPRTTISITQSLNTKY